MDYAFFVFSDVQAKRSLPCRSKLTSFPILRMGMPLRKEVGEPYDVLLRLARLLSKQRITVSDFAHLIFSI